MAQPQFIDSLLPGNPVFIAVTLNLNYLLFRYFQYAFHLDDYFRFGAKVRKILTLSYTCWAGRFLIGGAARYLVSLMMKGAGKGFPWATFVVNLVGCFMIGLLWGLFSRTASEDNNWALFLSVGLCGGFTTFSTFSKEALIMLQSGNIWAFAGYIALSVSTGVALVALGYYLCR